MKSNSHTILLVDDNDDLREVTAELLEALGHRVLTAARPEAALIAFERHRAEIDLLVTECIFSGMSGVELVQRVRGLEPALGALLISSHNNHLDLRQRIERGEMAFLRKPFSIDELAGKVDEAAALGGGSATPRRTRETASAPSSIPPGGLSLELSTLVAVDSPDAGQGAGPGMLSGALWRAVAAGTLAFAVLAGVRWISVQPPGLPDRVPESVTRGTRIEALYPMGEVTAVPRELRWRPYQDAAVYQAHLLSVDDSILWEGNSNRPRILLPEGLRSHLHPRVVYFWTIDAFDEEGLRLSGSDRVRFLVGAQPASGEEPEPPS